MKNLFFLFILLIISQEWTIAQRLNLTGFWKFKTGDSLTWLQPDYNDHHWDSISTGIPWKQSLKADVNGFTWYRSTIIISKSFQKPNETALLLRLGRISDADQVFFNGQMIGSTDNPPVEDLTPGGIYRKYFIPHQIIRWNNENTIAIRVFNIKKAGGLISGPIEITSQNSQYFAVETRDRLVIKLEDAGEFKIGVPTKINLNIHNTSEKPVNGRLKAGIYNFSHINASNAEFSLSLKPGDSIRTNVIFTPTSCGFYMVNCELVENNSSEYIQGGSLIVPEQVKVAKIQGFADFLYAGMPGMVVPKVTTAYTPFSLANIQVDGYLGDRLKLLENFRILHADTAWLLRKFRIRGYKTEGKTYDGEHIGKFFNAACNTYVYTRNHQIKELIYSLFHKWMKYQLSDGYFGTYLPGEYWDDWDVWVHKYDLMGLLSIYTTFDDHEALQAAEKIGDLLYNTFVAGNLKIEEVGRHMGMASTSLLDPMVDLYRYTGNNKYLEICNLIIQSYDHPNGPGIIKSLLTSKSVFKTANAKAYEMLSNLVGVAKLYEINGDIKLLQACQNAWEDIVSHRLFITGTTSNDEHFNNDYHFLCKNEDEVGEGCVTTTWIQLNALLFSITGEERFMGCIEQSLYNHALAAFNPKMGGVSYFTPLEGIKNHSGSITCCLSSITRAISSIPALAFGKYGNGFAINLYNPGYFKGMMPKGGISVVVKETSQWEETSLIIDCTESSLWPLYLRIPSWCKTYTVTIGNKQWKGIPGSYLEISRTWAKHEEVTIRMDAPEIRIDGEFYSSPSSIAIQKGPQVMALDSKWNTFSIYSPMIVPNPLKMQTTPAPGDGWVGKTMLKLNTVSEGASMQSLLVPFSDAGQLMEEFNVWIRLKN